MNTARHNFLPGALYRRVDDNDADGDVWPKHFARFIMIVSAVALEPHAADGKHRLVELQPGRAAPIMTQRRRSFWSPLWEDADVASR